MALSEVASSSPAADGPETDQRVPAPIGRVRAYLALALLVGGVVSWRRRTYFSGGFDPVVVLKAMLVALALVLVVSIPKRPAWERLPMSILVLLVVYATETALGGWTLGNMFPSLVLSVRLLMTAAVVIVLVAKFEAMHLFQMMSRVMLGFAIVSMVTGGVQAGRLTGGLPPLSPNELALLSGVTVIYIAWLSLNDRGSLVLGLAFVVLLAMVYLTGSRTGLAFLIIALLAMLVQARRVPIVAFLSGIAIIPLVVYVIGATGVVKAFADRGGEGNITTLSSRTIAWGAAFDRGGSLVEKLFGGGLALKQIPVAGQYWNQQTLDSTPISALVQGGYLGMFLFAIWAIVAMVGAFRSARPERLLWTSLLVFVIGRCFLESGMLDSTVAFLIFFTVSLIGRPPRTGRSMSRDLVSWSVSAPRPDTRRNERRRRERAT